MAQAQPPNMATGTAMPCSAPAVAQDLAAQVRQRGGAGIARPGAVALGAGHANSLWTGAAPTKPELFLPATAPTLHMAETDPSSSGTAVQRPAIGGTNSARVQADGGGGGNAATLPADRATGGAQDGGAATHGAAAGANAGRGHTSGHDSRKAPRKEGGPADADWPEGSSNDGDSDKSGGANAAPGANRARARSAATGGTWQQRRRCAPQSERRSAHACCNAHLPAALVLATRRVALARLRCSMLAWSSCSSRTRADVTCAFSSGPLLCVMRNARSVLSLKPSRCPLRSSRPAQWCRERGKEHRDKERALMQDLQQRETALADAVHVRRHIGLRILRQHGLSTLQAQFGVVTCDVDNSASCMHGHTASPSFASYVDPWPWPQRVAHLV